ncbi:50S ribosomal protein L25/general stress protein Ctc [Propioniciclava coleopterorum]|uniref:Large ribosomal subunit protein bL25 n=1 Tax=Propioniciclava coleopterorum TaxID=2714937 RepID=A0A6G7Y4H3_9ACTN|nr:50S ribosomal protein L25/general stress protein Ctc [Propioniciclava coleopterorum]QIK71609.1 50S ribosomal protein L25/general stress protein Ctc [Propioniciclava coleopterorum]
MTDELRLEAESRTEFGKGAARRIRRANKVPAVIYGHGGDPIHISLPGHETLLALRTANALLTLVIDGGKKQLALPKQVQRDPITGFLDHVDLVIVKKGEKVTVEVPLLVTGTVKDDRILVMDQQSITLEVAATNIPAHIEIPAGELEIGEQVTAADLNLPEGAVFPGEPTDLILSIAPAPTTEELDAELDAAVAGASDEAPAEAEESAEAEDAAE